jgi:hypothetical protein
LVVTLRNTNNSYDFASVLLSLLQISYAT